MDYSVYGLSAEPDQIRYIGITKHGLDSRLKAHLQDADRHRQGHKRCWLRSVLDTDRAVEIEQLDEAPSGPEGLWLERLWIAVYRMCGVRLTNTLDGGTDAAGFKGHHHTEESRQKTSQTIRLKWANHTPEERMVHGRSRSQEERDAQAVKMIENWKIRPVEVKEAARQAVKSYWTEEQKAKKSTAMADRWDAMSAEERQALAQQRSQSALKRWANMSSERRSVCSRGLNRSGRRPKDSTPSRGE